MGKTNIDIVLSHPFSGSIYAFFKEQESGKPIADNIYHPYYRTLYGKKYAEVRDLALTQLLLYDKVYIAPADNPMPDASHSLSEKYENDKLGLYTDWSVYNELRFEIDEQVLKDLHDPLILKYLVKVPPNSKRQILSDCRLEIALANRYNCPILSSGGRSKIIKRLAKIDQELHETKQIKSESIIATEHYLDIIGLTFNPVNYQLLCDYKQDQEVRIYAKAFLKILNKIENKTNVRTQLLQLMMQSMEKQNLMKKASGVLNVSSIWLSILGFIPLVGPFFSGGSLLATGASKTIDKSTQRIWLEFGSRIRKITDFTVLKKKIEKELYKNEILE